jgi:hypothetical protein
MNEQVIESKVRLGQYYTRVSPFEFARFQAWLTGIPNITTLKFIEPFSGSNSIIRMIINDFPSIKSQQWSAFDIDPEAHERSLVPEVKAQTRDTIKSFPKGFDVCITNPPYLAKNSATRKGTEFNFGAYQDVFEISLREMLNACAWVAAIIPESFLTRGVFHNRLEFVISLTQNMFDDTEFPVCLAVFSPSPSSDFEVWRNDTWLGNFSDLELARDAILSNKQRRLFQFNDPDGAIGLFAVDMTKGPSIRFVNGRDIDSKEIKHSSRAITRISPKFSLEDVLCEALILEANAVLASYREKTHDVFLTSFKGLRADACYRRRLDWKTASLILSSALGRLAPATFDTESISPKFPW